MKILIAVTHLLGIGHFARMRRLADGLAAAGHDVTLVSGGRPVPHFNADGFAFVQLPPVHCVGTDFSTLYEADGQVLTPQTRARRTAALVASCKHIHPDLVITETFPFGRRALKDEFIALCETADALRPRPAIVSSIRDILNPPSSQAKADEAERMIDRFFDAIVVHGDAEWVAPQAGWPFGPHGQSKLCITGYIDEAVDAARAVIPHGRILVSGGGSAASLPLFRAAIAAARLLSETRWHMLVGHGVSDEVFASLVNDAPATMIVERARKDFRALLRGACLSISQAGYNTVVDNFDAGIPMVLVPFAAGQEQEQTLRANALAAQGMAHLVPESDLSAASLAGAVNAALSAPHGERPAINRDGVHGSIAALQRIAQDRHAIENAWSTLETTLATIKQSGEHLQVWWRDDDAIAPTPALARLLALAHTMHTPVALAVIPDRAQSRLADVLPVSCDVLIHGVAHINHAPPTMKKQELGFRAPDAIVADLKAAAHHLQMLLGARVLPVLVPPWNRIDPDLLPLLPEAGIRGLSTFKLRESAEPVPGLRQINTHCDPIAWHHAGRRGPEVELVRAVTRTCQALAQQPTHEREAFGLLTHHLVHDEAIWAFVQRLLATFAASGAVRFVSAQALFDVHQTVPPGPVLE